MPFDMFYSAVPVSDVLHVDRVREDDDVLVDVHRGNHPLPHDDGGVLERTRKSAFLLSLWMA